MFGSRKWTKVALVMNVAGTFLLFYSFQATSSDFRLVTAKSYSVVAGEIKQYALCVNNYTLLETDSRHGIMVGSANCPDWQHARPAAVVNIEHPSFLTIGFSLLFFGFIMGKYRAVCPVHGGEHSGPLSIMEGHSWVLVHCFGGCELSVVLGAVGMTVPPQAGQNHHYGICAREQEEGITALRRAWAKEDSIMANVTNSQWGKLVAGAYLFIIVSAGIYMAHQGHENLAAIDSNGDKALNDSKAAIPQLPGLTDSTMTAPHGTAQVISTQAGAIPNLPPVPQQNWKHAEFFPGGVGLGSRLVVDGRVVETRSSDLRQVWYASGWDATRVNKTLDKILHNAKAALETK